MADLNALEQAVTSLLGEGCLTSEQAFDALTIEIAADQAVAACTQLRDHTSTRFEQLIDLCAVDYSAYGAEAGETWTGSRFAVVLHLQSVEHNHRLRVRIALDDELPAMDSLTAVWPVANWLEREAFDLFGVLFRHHPDLRRLLTDYGFIGHPFRKDFPLSGHVEMRYDEQKGRVIYEPITLEPRVLVPRSVS